MKIRKASTKDKEALYELYIAVSENEFGIARLRDEITESYIQGLLEISDIMLVGVNEVNQALIAEIHCAKYGIKIFDHILTNLTIVVHPEYQRKGFGKQIFKALLEEVVNTRPEIKRIELESRSSNQKSIGLYQQLGFVQEGRMKIKTKNNDGTFEDSILMAWTRPEELIGKGK